MRACYLFHSAPHNRLFLLMPAHAQTFSCRRRQTRWSLRCFPTRVLPARCVSARWRHRASQCKAQAASSQRERAREQPSRWSSAHAAATSSAIELSASRLWTLRIRRPSSTRSGTIVSASFAISTWVVMARARSTCFCTVSILTSQSLSASMYRDVKGEGHRRRAEDTTTRRRAPEELAAPRSFPPAPGPARPLRYPLGTSRRGLCAIPPWCVRPSAHMPIFGTISSDYHY